MHTDLSLLDTIMEALGDAVFVVDADNRLLRVNGAFERLVGLTAAAVVGERLSVLGGVEGQPEGATRVAEAIAARGLREGGVVLPGRAGHCHLTVTPIREAAGTVGFVGILRPQQADAGHEEGIDRLTGLPNRHRFVDRVEQALLNAQRGGKSVALMLMGVDRFSLINEGMGEAVGDAILKQLAERLRHCVRTSDTVARLEGDRFAFVMQITAINDSVTVAEKILGAFATPFAAEGYDDVVITCSVGASIYPADGTTPDELLKNAAVALHHAKQGGRNRYQFFANEMNVRARHRLELESGIRRALANGELRVYYQPKIEVGSGRVGGFEALVRWIDPDKGMISPGEFIPVAEESGLIEQIGHWVLEETCRQNRQWQVDGLAPVRASVNVSARQFRHRDFVASVEAVLQATGLEPQWLELEITESMLIGDIDAMVARMEALRAVGVSLSIDDFGTGYSSLSYLSRFPITTLKIDRAFIRDVQTNPHTAEIARAIIGLSHGLNLEVVAEGAELKEHIDFLRDHGCELVQGFYYSRPLPADEFTTLLRDGVSAPG